MSYTPPTVIPQRWAVRISTGDRVEIVEHPTRADAFKAGVIAINSGADRAQTLRYDLTLNDWTADPA